MLRNLRDEWNHFWYPVSAWFHGQLNFPRLLQHVSTLYIWYPSFASHGPKDVSSSKHLDWFTRSILLPPETSVNFRPLEFCMNRISAILYIPADTSQRCEWGFEHLPTNFHPFYRTFTGAKSMDSAFERQQVLIANILLVVTIVFTSLQTTTTVEPENVLMESIQSLIVIPGQLAKSQFTRRNLLFTRKDRHY